MFRYKGSALLGPFHLVFWTNKKLLQEKSGPLMLEQQHVLQSLM